MSEERIVWPVTLPLPLIEGYLLRPGEAIARTNMESGPARQRKRFEQVPTVITVSWVMQQEQFSIFEAWYTQKAKEGENWFWIPLVSGVGLAERESRFTRQFDAQFLGAGLWRISSQLEIREEPQMDPSLAEFLYVESLQGLQNAANAFHALIHEFYPSLFF